MLAPWVWLVAGVVGWKCADPIDCSLNGECDAAESTCVCDRGWSGDRCATLRLAPSVASESYVAPNHTSSWGMSVVSGPNGTLHGFVSEFANGCKLGSWGTNSYVNHVIAATPTGPWKQAGAAIPAWTHNPKVVFDPIEQMWVMYHIGDGTTHRPLQNCTSTLRQHARPHQVDAESKASSAAPFALHFSPSLDGPWKSLPSSGVGTGENNRAGAGPSLTTIYPGVSNVDAPAATPVPSGSVKLYEQPEHGNGTLTLSFSSFLRVSSYLAWDACGGATFDNGHAVEAANVGSRIGSFEVIGAGNVLAGNPCAIEWPSTPHVYGPFASSDGIVPVQDETNYFQVDAPGAGAGYRVVGTTEDAAGCRGVCESTSDCQSWTWDARNMSGPATVGKCFVRNDTLWYPNVTDGNPALVAAGRPWEFDGDNPTVVIDAVHGNLTALYRTDVDVGVGPQPMASLIGLATAPSWRGPYTLSGPYGGTLTTQQYPYDENEDPFIWKSKRGFHALFHANTWGDSRGKVFPVPANAGRLAYSVDGFLWTYSDTPPFNGTVAYSNGTHAPFARVERPVLLFDPSGTPTHLINGVQRYVNDDYTFTLIRRIDHS
eukprot:m.28176 g.28176  ORF g.28176 m.28176 type:complete len:600 (+) comp11997_c0_seq2:24-1823(+)